MADALEPGESRGLQLWRATLSWQRCVTANPDDSRARLVDVTAEGAELAVRAIRLVEETDRSFFADVGDQRALVEMLKALGR